MNTLIQKISVSKYNKLIVTLSAVVVAVALPQLCHLLGLVSGTGNTIGRMLQPMYLSVFLAGLLAGPLAGVIVGAVSPILSWSLTQMPAVALLPAMTLELAVIGLVCGMLRNININSFFKVLIAQIAGHIAYALTVVVSIYVFGSSAITFTAMWSTFAMSLLGVVLQWILVPSVLNRVKGALNNEQ